MSDDSYKDGRHGKPTPPPRRGAEVRTMIGLPIVDPSDAVRAGLTADLKKLERERQAHAPTQEAPTHRPPAAGASGDDLSETDTRYMDPPSEALGRARTEEAMLPQISVRPAPARASRHAPNPQQPASFFNDLPSTRPAGPAMMPASEQSSSGPFGPHGTGHSRSEPYGREPSRSEPYTSRSQPQSARPGDHGQQRFSNHEAPEAWRQDMRRVAQQRAPSISPPASQSQAQPPRRDVSPAAPTAAGSLRLKLDLAGDSEDYHYKGVPKSTLPKLLIWLVLLGGAGAGASYYVDTHGGLDKVLVQAQQLRATVMGEAPTVAPVPPPAAVPSDAPTTPTAPVTGTTPSDPAATQPAAATPSEAAPKPTPEQQAATEAALQEPGEHPEQAAPTEAQPAQPSQPVTDKPVARAPEKPKPAPKRAAKPARSHAPRAAAAAEPDVPPAPGSYPGPSLPPPEPPPPEP